MTRGFKQHYWLYLLATLLLFMQAFSLWHDAAHPFHTASLQCEQMATVDHTPAKPTAATSIPFFITQTTEILPGSLSEIIGRKPYDHHSIRAPPAFS